MTTYENRIKTKWCDCGRDKLMTGHQSQYNARLNNGNQCCPTCKIEEITLGGAKQE